MKYFTFTELCTYFVSAVHMMNWCVCVEGITVCNVALGRETDFALYHDPTVKKNVVTVASLD